MEKICVAIRVRPPTKQNSVRGHHWKVSDNSISLLSGNGTIISGHTFAFGAFSSNFHPSSQPSEMIGLSEVCNISHKMFYRIQCCILSSSGLIRCEP